MVTEEPFRHVSVVDESVATKKPLGPCGHRHQLWESAAWHRTSEPAPWRVSTPVKAWPTQDDRDATRVVLAPGTLLRHDQSDWTLQGCLGCEDLHVWERFAVLDGAEAGRCVELCATNPAGTSLSVIPPELEPV